MRVNFPEFSRRESALQLKAILWFVVGVALLLLGAFWIFGGMLVAWTAHKPAEIRLGFVAVGLVGAIPLLLSTLCLLKGFTLWRKKSRYLRLVLTLKSEPDIEMERLASALSLARDKLEILLLEALGAGFIVDETSNSAEQSTPRSRLEIQPIHPGEEHGGAERNVGAATAPTVLAPSSRRLSLPKPTTPPAAIALDKTISGALLNDTYQLEERLGAGGMGVVYGARHIRTGVRLAVKVLLPELRFSEKAFQRFKAEAVALTQLLHPGIVQIWDFDQTPEGIVFLAMDRLEGESLASRIEWRGSLPWAEAKNIALEAGAALNAAHEKGILHRDFKPSNVFLAQRKGEMERVVLLDFGLASPTDRGAASRVTRPSEVLGSPLYMPPEQARGVEVDVRSEVYSFGAVLYELLTGAPPFIDATLAALYARVLSEAPPPASEVAAQELPSGLDEVLWRCLAKNPDERFQDIPSLLHTLSVIEA